MLGRTTRYRRRGLVAALAVAFLMAWGAAPASAGIGVSPSKVELQADAGDTVPFSISVTNDSDNPVNTVTFAWDFARDETGMPTRIGPQDAERFRGCSAWITTPLPPPTEIPTGGTTTLEFEVVVPDSTPDGTYYCYVTLDSTPIVPEPEVPEGGYTVQTPVTYSMSAMLLVGVGDADMSGTPALKRGVAVENMEVKSVSLDGSVPVNLQILNEGNVHANLVEGSRIQIWKGDTLADEITFQEYTLLPENSIVIPAVWQADASFGRYTARFVGDIGGEDFLVAEDTFWVVDWQVLVAVAIGLLALALVSVLFFRRFKIQLAPRSDG